MTDAAGGAAPALARGEERVERTGRWRGVYGLALAATAVAMLVGRPVAVLAGLAGVGFAAYARIWEAPSPDLAVTRRVSETDPAPGERVRVTLSVTNRSGRLLPDVRLCDDVPAGLEVVEGTPRHTTALRPGKRAVVAYEFEAVRGRHRFDSLTVVTRDVSGASRRRKRVPTDGSTVVCRPRYDEAAVPLGDLATRLVGREQVSAVGEGLAFHSVREYRRGDALSSVDWNRLAKDGDLATRRFDQPRTVRVVLVVDARRAAYVTADDGTRRPAVDACVYAAGALASGLLDASSRVGLAAFSPRRCWIEPGAGGAHRRRLLDRLTTDDAFGWRPPATDAADATAPRRDANDGRDGALLDRLVSRLPSDAQVVLLSPFVDEAPAELARHLIARGYDVHVASPDPTATDSPYRRLAGLERGLRLDSVRRAGAAVVEWDPTRTPEDGADGRPDGARGERVPGENAVATDGRSD